MRAGLVGLHCSGSRGEGRRPDGWRTNERSLVTSSRKSLRQIETERGSSGRNAGAHRGEVPAEEEAWEGSMPGSSQVQAAGKGGQPPSRSLSRASAPTLSCVSLAQDSGSQERESWVGLDPVSTPLSQGLPL